MLSRISFVLIPREKYQVSTRENKSSRQWWNNGLQSPRPTEGLRSVIPSPCSGATSRQSRARISTRPNPSTPRTSPRRISPTTPNSSKSVSSYHNPLPVKKEGAPARVNPKPRLVLVAVHTRPEKLDLIPLQLPARPVAHLG